MDDMISRQTAIDAVENLVSSMSVCINVDEYNGMRDMKYRALKAIKECPSAPPEPLTDKEQRIFLSAMEREEIVCKQYDDKHRNCREPYEDSLVSVCRNIMRKVKGALWTT